MKILSIVLFILFGILALVFLMCLGIAIYLKIKKKKSIFETFNTLFVDLFIKTLLKEIFKGFHPKNWFEKE